MNTGFTTPFRGYAFLALASALLVCTPALAAEPWTIKEFEVIGIVPEGAEMEFSLDDFSDDAYRTLQEMNLVDPYFPETFRAIPVDPAVRAAIEGFLHDSAVKMEAWGFPEPQLKPIVENSAGRRAYRVYLVGFLANAAGKYKQSCDSSVKQILLLDEMDVLDQSPGQEDDPSLITAYGFQTIAHELFHSVQFNSPFYECIDDARPVGKWITEGTARAVGWDVAQALKPLELYSFGEKRWGLRDYSWRLPVEQLYQGDAAPRHKSRLVDAYGTSSFWRYLAEIDASGFAPNDRPGPEEGPVSYRYLADMLNQPAITRDCISTAAACKQEVDWLNARLIAAFGSPLRMVYTAFIEALTKYAEHRPNISGGENWRNRVFRDKCQEVYFATGAPNQTVEDNLEKIFENSARCFEVKFGTSAAADEYVKVEFKVSAPGKEELLPDLNAAVAGQPMLGKRGDVYEDAETGQRVASWIFQLPKSEPSQVILTNVADRPSTSEALENLPFTFKVLKEYAFIGDGPGPSAADIDAPLPFTFPEIKQALVMAGPLESHVEAGLQDVCMVQFQFHNPDTGDGLLLKMDREGQLEQGSHYVHAGSSYNTEDFPGEFVVGLSIGPGNPMGMGWSLAYQGVSGTVEFDSVSKHFIKGSADLNLEYGSFFGCIDPQGRKPALGNGIECPEMLRNIVVHVEFGVEPHIARGSEILGKSIEQCTGEKPFRRNTSTPADDTPTATAPGEDGPPILPPVETDDGGDDTGHSSSTEPGQSDIPGSEGRPMSGDGDGAWVGDGPQWFRIIATGDIESATHVPSFQLMASCDGSNRAQLGFYEGNLSSEDYIQFSVTTADVVGTGQTSTFELSEIVWDNGMIPAENMPPELNILAPNRFQGTTGTLELTAHSARHSNRYMEGVIRASGLSNRPGQVIDIEAAFRMEWSCGIE